MFSRFGKKRVWGRDASDLELRFEGIALEGLVRPNSGVVSVVVRPGLGQDHYRSEVVRRANREWLQPWDATLPPGSVEKLPTWHQFTRQLDEQMRDKSALTMVIEVNGEIAGQVAMGAVEHGALSQGILGYWIAERWGGLGVTSLAVAAVIDLVIGELGLHRVEVNVRPNNERSLGLCRKLHLREEGYKPRFMSIAGNWEDHVSFGVDAEDLESGPLVERIRRR